MYEKGTVRYTLQTIMQIYSYQALIKLCKELGLVTRPNKLVAYKAITRTNTC